MYILFCKIWLGLTVLIQAKLQLALMEVQTEERKKTATEHLTPAKFSRNSHEIFQAKRKISTHIYSSASSHNLNPQKAN